MEHLKFRKKTIFCGLFAVVLFWSFLESKSLNSNFEGISVAKNGLSTCFYRVGQTYSAKLIGQSLSNYLSTTFKASTQDCLAEVSHKIEELNNIENSGVLQKLNTLSSETFWFHQFLEKGNNSITNAEFEKTIGMKFERVEKIYDEAIEATTNLSLSLKASIINLIRIQWFVFIGILLGIGLILRDDKLKINFKRKIESSSKVLLEDGKNVIKTKVEDVLESVYLENGLFHTLDLFRSLSRSDAPKNYTDLIADSYEDIVKGNVVNALPIESVLKRKNTIPIEKVKKVTEVNLNLDKVISKVIDGISGKLFTNGIRLDLKVEEKINVIGKEEELEIILHHIFIHSINSLIKNSNTKFIELSMRKLGSVLLLDIKDNAELFSQNLIRNHENEEEIDKLGIDFQIAMELVRSFHSEIILENIEEDSILKRRIRLKLKVSKEVSESTLIDIKVGTKKKILEEIHGNA